MSGFLVQGARVFDGGQVLPVADVLVEGETIAAVGERIDAPPAVEVVDGHGRTLLPGLIDCHTHVFGPVLGQTLVFGVTTTLDMFSLFPARVAKLRAQAAARNDLADLRSAGVGATAPGGHPSQFPEIPPFPTVGPDTDVSRFVAERVAEGSDYLKIFIEDGTVFGTPVPALAPPVIAALVEAAHDHGLLAVAHISALASAYQALDAGIDGLVHLFVDQPADPGFARRVAEAGVFVVPTLTVAEGVTGTPGGAELLSDPRLAPYLKPSARADLTQVFPHDPSGGGSVGFAMEAVAQLGAAGVAVLAGTDAPNAGTAHGVSMHRELSLLVQAGLSPVGALMAATSAAAHAFGLHDRGQISPGLQADLLLVDGDPTTDITATRAIAAVWRRGVRAERQAQTLGS
ncbi:MAG: amidohydrolase family protein [Egibacteraceae bacterium]